MNPQQPVYPYPEENPFAPLYYSEPVQTTHKNKGAIISFSILAILIAAFFTVYGISSRTESQPVPSVKSSAPTLSNEDMYIQALDSAGITGNRTNMIQQGYMICEMLEAKVNYNALIGQIHAGSVASMGSRAISLSQAQILVDTSQMNFCSTTPYTF